VKLSGSLQRRLATSGAGGGRPAGLAESAIASLEIRLDDRPGGQNAAPAGEEWILGEVKSQRNQDIRYCY
jgi:hypothetical protein